METREWVEKFIDLNNEVQEVYDRMIKHFDDLPKNPGLGELFAITMTVIEAQKMTQDKLKGSTEGINKSLKRFESDPNFN